MSPEKELIHKEITGEVIKAGYEVHNTLGCGFLEKVYENALVRELELRKKKVSQQKGFTIIYKGKEMGTYYADLVVEDKVVVEIKAVEEINDIHRAQLLNYLRISGLRVGLIINFGKPRLKYERLAV